MFPSRRRSSAFAIVAVAVASAHLTGAALLTPRADRTDCGTVTSTAHGVNQCICRQNIPAFIDQDPFLQESISAGTATRDQIITALNAHLTDSVKEHTAQTCTFPDNATPISFGNHECVASNPCDFTCDTDYVRKDDSCVPVNELAPRAPQGSMGMRRRDLDWKSARCTKATERVCGVWYKGSTAFECVEVMNNLESCGGCMNPLRASETIGRDCTAIPGTADVSCIRGKCELFSCKKGYTLTAALDGSGDQACLNSEQLEAQSEPRFQLGNQHYDYSVTATQLLRLVDLLRERKGIDYEAVVGNKMMEHARHVVGEKLFKIQA